MHVPHTPMHVVAPTGAGRSGPRGGAAAGAGTRGSAGQCPRPVFCSAPWKGPSLLVAVSTGLRTSSVTCSDSEPLLLCAAGRPDPRPVPPRHSPENGGVQGRHAEPPARGYQGGGGGGGDGGRSFENYKGILLCDRPSEQKMVVGVTEQPFLPPGRPDRDLFGMGGRGEGCLGLQPSHERMNRNNVARQARMQNSRGTAPTALSKHKKWLKNLSKDAQRSRMAQVETDLEKDDQRKRFQDTERKKRAAIKADKAIGNHPSIAATLNNGRALAADVELTSSEVSQRDDLDVAAPSPSASSLPAVTPVSPPATNIVTQATTPSVPTGPKPSKSKPKPKWAMTEDEAFEAEMRENQKLVDFAMDLDFAKFVDDYEVREALCIMRQRCEDLAAARGESPLRARADDDAEDGESVAASDAASSTAAEVGAARKAERKKLKALQRLKAIAMKEASHDKDWDASSTLGGYASKLIGDDALRLAEYVLTKSEHLKQIHSKQSLAKVLQDIALNKNISLAAKEVPVEAALREPVVSETKGNVTLQQKARILTDLKHSKDYVQNLPYLYRCPSI
eukprot:TRINITY_DN1607_c0_g1_i8.p1 TRINITY_DN1607_c0_g1~~TRINITY_DN1607_c0_g1_i8.p1  ORF type:complete len:564 (+),score=180.08 TRINITY_DN1607_c0_g1_i8:384-2075(+)